MHYYFKCRRIRDELANQNAETTNLTNKLDRVSTAGNNTVVCCKLLLCLSFSFLSNCAILQEIHALRAQLEAAKYDVIKYCIGTLVSISAVGLAVIRILM